MKKTQNNKTNNYIILVGYHKKWLSNSPYRRNLMGRYRVGASSEEKALEIIKAYLGKLSPTPQIYYKCKEKDVIAKDGEIFVETTCGCQMGVELFASGDERKVNPEKVKYLYGDFLNPIFLTAEEYKKKVENDKFKIIYTSYFSSKKYDVKDGVAITLGGKFWKGETCKELAPKPELLNWWKSLTKEEQKTSDMQLQYEAEYYKQLENLDVDEMAKKLNNKVLLCFEKSDDFCHRHIVAKWFNNNGYECKEL